MNTIYGSVLSPVKCHLGEECCNPAEECCLWGVCVLSHSAHGNTLKRPLAPSSVPTRSVVQAAPNSHSLVLCFSFS